MSYHLKSDYNFDVINSITPDMVMRDICDELGKITKGFVAGNVCEYDGEIESYNPIETMAALTANLQSIMRINVQDKLGEIDDVNFKYELYLSANQIANYKYRILFAGYGISSYPVKVVVEQEIADELNNEEDSGYIYMAESKDEFERLLINIFNSKTIQKIIQNLITVSKEKLLARRKESDDVIPF